VRPEASRPRAILPTAVALAVLAGCSAGHDKTVDQTPTNYRGDVSTRISAPPSAPRWLERLAFAEAARLGDPRPRAIELKLGRRDTIVLRGHFVCRLGCTQTNFAGRGMRGSYAVVTVRPATRSVDAIIVRG
jgi:hypothetical protein